MQLFEQTRLWQSTLAVVTPNDGKDQQREELRQAYLQMRSRVSTLVAEIPQDLRDFTVHDVTHLDALWEMADLIAGEDYHPTPAEGFVFGGALLLHDAGMALCAMPDGLSSIQSDNRWQDSLALLWQRKTGRVARRIDVEPGGAATEDAELTRRATAEVLRFRHAERAESLLTQTWQLRTGEHYQILENANLRDIYGVLIGQLAHSHWWPVEKLEQSFKRERPAPDRFPREWKVDPLRIACLLRAADAIHLDERRAPRFLQALRRPEGNSQLHWDFQGKMLRPQFIKELGLVEFVSSSPFALEQKDAWWLGFDTLESVDRELRDIDALLAENRRSRFAVHGVAHIGVPTRLAQTIEVKGWSPVDARLHVGDVARLARTLGGEQLYGHSQSVPLRELIQNASDAVRARRILDSSPQEWGRIDVRVGQDKDGHYVEVEDTGTGMSASVLTGPFLDFGQSFWNSWRVLDEHPGLAGQGFQATGRFGVGFFSVFMWADHVQVTTRLTGEAQDATRVLEFQRGLDVRPLMRPAQQSEYMRDGGTRVRLWLHKSPYEPGGFLMDYNGREQKARDLKGFCAWLCPTLDVDLWTQENDQPIERAVQARDWITMDGALFLSRLWDFELYEANWPEDKEDKWRDRMSTLGSRLRLIKASPSSFNAGQVIGRACLYVQHNESADFTRAIVTIGGFRANIIESLAGVLLGQTTAAPRNAGEPFADDELIEWAQDQTPLLISDVQDTEHLAEYSEIARVCRAHTGDLPLAQYQTGWLTANQIEDLARHQDEFFIMEPSMWSHWKRKHQEEQWILDPNILLARSGRPLIFRGGSEEFNAPSNATQFEKQWWSKRKSIYGAVLEAIARGWQVPLEKLIKSYNQYTAQPESEERIVGTFGDQVYKYHVSPIRRP